MSDATRAQILSDLIELRSSPAEANASLRRLGWGEEEVVHLGPAHLLAVLRRFTSGGLTALEVTAWADAVDLRDDIGRMAGTEELVNDVLLEMSSPELFEDLEQAAPALVARLEAVT